MKRNISFFVLAAIVSCGGQIAKGNPHVNILINQFPKTGGGFTYQAINNSDNGQLTAPDGTVLPNSRFTTFDSFAGLGAKLFGNWTASNFPVYPNTSFVFDVEPFTVADVGLETPVIVSPAPGSTVPEQFVVKWEFPTGKSGSSSFAYASYKLSQIVLDTLTHGADGPNSEGFGFTLVAPGPISLPVGVTAVSNLSPPIIYHSPELDGLNLVAAIRFSTTTTTVTYQVAIPEPCSAALFAFSAMIFGMRRSRV